MRKVEKSTMPVIREREESTIESHNDFEEQE